MVFVSVATSSVSAQSLPTDAKPSCTVSPSLFASWFESGSVSLNGVVSPADSVTFPDSPNCSFYQWSEQMYLWLTSPAPPRYGGGGRIFDSPVFYDVSPPDSMGNRTFIPHTPGLVRVFSLRAAQVGRHGLPIVFDKAGKLFEVERSKLGPSGKLLILNQLSKPTEIDRVTLEKGKPIFLDKTGKAIAKPKAIVRPEFNKAPVVQKFMVGRIPIFLDSAGNVIDVEQGQAGGGDVLRAQSGSLVYYVTMVNDVYAYFLTGTKNGGITPAPTRFPTTATDLNKIVAFAAAHGKTFTDPDALAIEVKSSWVEVAGLSNLSSYITMTATIPTYDTANQNQWIPNGQKTVQLAMVGMHVVGSTGGLFHSSTGITGHPEMIWATWEHFGNAPNATYKYIDNNNVTKTETQNTAGPWLFSTSGSAGPFNAAHMFFNSPNINSISSFTISPSDTIRMKAFGGGFDFSPNPLDATTAASNTEIISINNSVLGQLVSGDIRANYFMTGSTWTIFGAPPTGPFKTGGNGNEVGTSQLANTTMETYQQGPSNLWSAGVNCFACHVNNTTSVSHIFPGLQPLFP